MIKKIEVKNFKLFKELSVPIKNLNLLSGLNGMGKSTLFQVLLLLRQSGGDKNSLNLNGDLLYSGISNDILCHSASPENKKIEIHIHTEKDEHKWSFPHNPNKDYLEGSYYGNANLSLYAKNFQYINADHIGPSESHDRNDIIVEKYNQMSVKSGRAELAVQYLETYGGHAVKIKELLHPDAKDDSLKSQVEQWLQEVSPGVHLDIQKTDKDFLLTFKYEIEKSGTKVYTKNFKPQNVGFALSYTLPYIIAILSSEPGSLLLFENPEAHLHPRGQAKLTELMCIAAGSGIQIFVETHGDHIINETLVQLKEHISNQEKGIDLENVNILFFDREEDDHIGNVKEIKIKQEGKIINPPPHFFDQYVRHQRRLWS